MIFYTTMLLAANAWWLDMFHQFLGWLVLGAIVWICWFLIKKLPGLLTNFSATISKLKLSPGLKTVKANITQFALTLILIVTIFIHIIFALNTTYGVQGISTTLDKEQYNYLLRSSEVNPIYIVENTTINYPFGLSHWAVYIFYGVYLITLLIILNYLVSSFRQKRVL